MTVHTPHPTKDVSALTKNRIIAPIILGIAIFIGILITRPVYINYIDAKTNLTKLEGDLRDLSNEHNALLSIKNNIE